MSGADTQFSKERLEMLCDGIFAIAASIALVFIAPVQAMLGLVSTQAIVNLASRRAAARR